MWLKSHHWVDVPYTRTERRKILNVRESAHTVMLFDRKYYDCDTGKYDTDKLPTLYHSSLADLIVSDCAETGFHSYRSRYYEEERAYFVPKDNDFDEECARDDQLKQEREQREKRESEKDEEGKRLFHEHRERLARELEESKARQAAYDKQLAEVEVRIKAQQQLRARLAHESEKSSGHYIITYSGKRRVG